MDLEQAAKAPDPASYGVGSVDVKLQNVEGVFFSGQTVKGFVILELLEPEIEILGIRLKCKGETRVHFTDRPVGIRRRYRDEESYIQETVLIQGDGKSPQKVSAGKYAFEIKIPEKSPCSFEGIYGRIRYSVRGILLVNKSVKFFSAITPFTVSSPSDLNLERSASQPIEEDQSKVFIGQKEPLRMIVKLPVRGFVPGQTVPISVQLTNNSNVLVAKVRIVLKKVVTYHATDKSRKHKEIVVEIEVPVEHSEEKINEYFDIPSIPPTGLNHCTIIDVRYSLKVEACVDLSEWYYRMLQKNLKIRTWIIVGTIPLHNYEEVVVAENILKTAGSYPSLLSGGQLFEKSQLYRSSKPAKDDPTGDEGDSDGELDAYSPLYAVYKFKKSGP